MKSIYKRIIGVCLIVFLLVGCNTEQLENKVKNSVASTNIYVQSVKTGHNFYYENVSYEQAFHNFFANPTWRYFNGTQDGPDDNGDGEPDYYVENVDVVEFTGECTYLDVDVKALIQFVVEEDTFEAVYLSFNDVPQSMIMLDALISKAFETYIEENTVEEGLEGNTLKTEESGYILFTQVGLYDHDEFSYLAEEYIPKIYLYSDGTFKFLCNYFEEMRILTGWWRIEEEIPKTYHCSVENYPGLNNLDFYLYHNESRCDAEFYSGYEEFGSTSVNEVLFHVENFLE